MPEKRTIHQRMIAIIEELPAIGKTQKNQQQGFMFRGHDDVMNALSPLMAKHGVFIVPDVVERIQAIRHTAKGGIMYEVNLHVRFTFYGADGDSITASGWGEGTDMGDKATNKAMTMAFKYVLNQAFALTTAEAAKHDADKHTPEETVAPRQEPKPDPPPAITDPGSYVINAGPYEGMKLEDAYREHPVYVIELAKHLDTRGGPYAAALLAEKEAEARQQDGEQPTPDQIPF